MYRPIIGLTAFLLGLGTMAITDTTTSVVHTIEEPSLVLITRSDKCPPCAELAKLLTPEVRARLVSLYGFKEIDFAHEVSAEDLEYVKNARIWGTPSIILNGKKYVGSSAFEKMRNIIKELGDE